MPSRTNCLVIALALTMVVILAYNYSGRGKEGFRVLVDPRTGTRNRDYRPYIDQEESARNLTLYDPYRPYYAGLYDSAHPPAQMWNSHFREQMEHKPERRPDYWVARDGTRSQTQSQLPAERLGSGQYLRQEEHHLTSVPYGGYDYALRFGYTGRGNAGPRQKIPPYHRKRTVQPATWALARRPYDCSGRPVNI